MDSISDSKKNYRKFLGIFLGVMLVIGGGYWLWDGYLSSGAKARRFAEMQAAQIEKAERAYIAAMTADTYGGKTPKETLDLFVAALKKGDIDLASKYFLLDENLSREKLSAGLIAINSQGNLSELISDLIKLQPYLKDIIDESDYRFATHNAAGKLTLYMNMQLNQYSKVWKIESL